VPFPKGTASTIEAPASPRLGPFLYGLVPYLGRMFSAGRPRRFLLRGSWADEDTYLVLENFGRLGCARSETDAESADRETLIRHLLRGEYSNPIRVVASEGWSRDVTSADATSSRTRSTSWRQDGWPLSLKFSQNAFPILFVPSLASSHRGQDRPGCFGIEAFTFEIPDESFLLFKGVLAFGNITLG
jgi:hypothetical protein